MADTLSDVYHSIKLTLDIFKYAHEPTADVPSKQTLLKAAEQIKADAAKIGLLCSGSSPPPNQLLSLATALQQSCVMFCSLCHTLTAAAGPSLKQELLRLAQSLVNPCLMLVKEMSSGKDLKPYVGVVWDGVSGVSKASFDNKTCIFKGLAAVMAVIKDTTRELEELRQEQQQEYGDANIVSSSSNRQQPDTAAAAAAEGGQAAAVADLDYDGGEMSSIERQLLDASLALIQAAGDTLKRFGKALLQGPELVAGSEAVDSWESCQFHSRHLRRAIEDLGAAMYPPQDFEEVSSASLAVFEVTELMADECPDAEAVGPQQLSTLAAALTAAHEKMSELVQQAQQQENNAEEAEAAEEDVDDHDEAGE